jgi:L-lactate utilization protein LutC
MQWDKLATEESIKTTVAALKTAGIESIVVESAEDASKKALELLPEHAEVMTMTSITLDTVGLSQTINNSEKYVSVRNKLNKLDRATQSAEMQKAGSAPEYSIGSVHAVTEDGKVVIASNTGSQLPAYAYGSQHVIWVVGTQKIVKNLDDAFTRIYDYVLPIETKRARKAYNLPDSFHSNVSKLLIFNKEVVPHRITIIFVKEKLGF